MPAATQSKKRRLSLAVLLAALVAGGALVPLAYKNRHAVVPEATVATAPAPEAPAAEEATPPAPPGTEVVPAEESETDRGPASASPTGPTLSYARAAGLHHTPDPLRLNSSVALLVNQDSGEVLVRKNDQAVLPIASLTKLMTALVVAEAKQPMDETLTITEEDVDTERHSRSRLRVGTTLTREEALRLALMSSENRAAHALGRAYPGGLEKMVAAMNAKAAQLGMKNTVYVDPTGLSNRNQSTARDVAVLVSHVGRNEQLAQFSTTPSHVADLGKRTLQYINSNRLVRSHRAGWDIEVQKTGYIVEAGRCLTMLTKVGGQNLIMVLLDADTNGARLADAERMRRWLVAQWGLPDPAVAEAKDDDKPVRKVAARKKADDEDRKKDKAVAKKDGGTKTAAAKKDGGKKTTAGKKDRRDDGDKSEVASAKGKKKDAKSEASAGKKGSKTQLAAERKKDGKKEDTRKDGRVRQTFASGKDEQKS
jgi:D-alanyl-D-alanine endopeptidase (penicillin-binding protein 7)